MSYIEIKLKTVLMRANEKSHSYVKTVVEDALAQIKEADEILKYYAKTKDGEKAKSYLKKYK